MAASASVNPALTEKGRHALRLSTSLVPVERHEGFVFGKRPHGSITLNNLWSNGRFGPPQPTPRVGDHYGYRRSLV